MIYFRMCLPLAVIVECVLGPDRTSRTNSTPLVILLLMYKLITAMMQIMKTIPDLLLLTNLLI